MKIKSKIFNPVSFLFLEYYISTYKIDSSVSLIGETIYLKRYLDQHLTITKLN